MKMLDVPQSGSVAGVTSSRNRFGQYRRTRAIPVNRNTGAQGTVRGRLSINAASWKALTANQRAAWGDLGSSMTRTDSLGQVQTLTGFAAYCSVNNNMLNSGNAVVVDAPAVLSPVGIEFGSVTLSNVAFTIAFTATPLAAGAKLQIYASPQRSAGRGFESDYRLVFTGAAATASPANVLAGYSAKFGAPVTGNRIFIRARVFQGGFLSGPNDMSQVVA